ncbi:hypothetical protein MJG53_011844 [Ovis ammon polii x Ovis aries]|uniref:Uncharacterized protein n=1 Tax=Ovis ammon polii x Ovis aries TaxID=2918886 RepID=A0ACB9UPI8_9CETA|nr:hypothetical protein MJG53_011844 [Ovis ammon polii x Ovis aries]
MHLPVEETVVPRSGRSEGGSSLQSPWAWMGRGWVSDEMDQNPPVRSEYLVSGIRTPPVRRNSKLATLGRIFKPWKWRKKKNEKLKQTTSALEKKMAGRQGREDLIKKGLLEMMEQAKMSSASREEEADATGSLPPSTDEPSQALAASDSLDSPPRPLERSVGQLPSPPLLPTPPPKAGSRTTRSVTGQATLFQGSGGKSTDPSLRGQLSTPTGSPHLTTVHRPLPPSRVIEELHRALATKHRQDSFQGRDSKGSPKKRMDVRLSRTCSVERGKEREEAWSFDGAPDGKRTVAKESEENKENLILNSELKDDLLLYQDEEALNDSIISGTLPRKCKKELLAVKLRNRPSRQELEDRNIFPQRTDEERQEIRQQIEMKLSKEGRAASRAPGPLQVGSGSGELAYDFRGSGALIQRWRRLQAGPGCEQQGSALSFLGSQSRRVWRYFQRQILSTPPCLPHTLQHIQGSRDPDCRVGSAIPTHPSDLDSTSASQASYLSRRLSQRPAVEELERRNILKQRNDQTEQEERREIKQRLTRKLNQRPTVDELRDRKILIRFSDYVEVAKAQDYDRRADKPWTRLSAADKAAIRKELNEYKSNEMEVHASSKHLTRSDFYLYEFHDTCNTFCGVTEDGDVRVQGHHTEAVTKGHVRSVFSTMWKRPFYSHHN